MFDEDVLSVVERFMRTVCIQCVIATRQFNRHVSPSLYLLLLDHGFCSLKTYAVFHLSYRFYAPINAVRIICKPAHIVHHCVSLDALFHLQFYGSLYFVFMILNSRIILSLILTPSEKSSIFGMFV